MNQLVEHLAEELRSAWRFRWIAFGVAGAVAVLGWLVVFALPDRYESSARVFVDTRTALKPVIKDQQAAARRAAAWSVPANAFRQALQEPELRMSLWPMVSAFIRRRMLGESVFAKEKPAGNASNHGMDLANRPAAP